MLVFPSIRAVTFDESVFFRSCKLKSVFLLKVIVIMQVSGALKVLPCNDERRPTLKKQITEQNCVFRLIRKSAC